MKDYIRSRRIILNTIIASFKNHPKDWVQDGTSERNLSYKDLSIRIWIGNRFFPYVYVPETIRFGWIGSFRLGRVVRRWLKDVRAKKKQETLKNTIKVCENIANTLNQS